MSSQIEKIRKIRLEKLKAIERTGVLAYPGTVKRTDSISQLLAVFTKLAQQKKEIFLAGRIRAIREHGGSTFINIEDGTGKIQCYLRENRLGQNSYQFFLKNFDIGDFIEIRGILFKTKKGEKTIEVANYKMLTKALLPLPEKWHGLKDIEERYRKRYLDLMFNAEVKKKFFVRSQIIKYLREFLEKQGFLEVETPALQPIYGGARARPFKTHLNALNMELYLRISPELYLKRLLIGGFEKVYEIGKVFRNEGMDSAHNPEFTELEFYWAYADYKDLMKLTEKMFQYILKKVFGGTSIEVKGTKINFKAPWQRIEFFEVLQKYTGIVYNEINKEGLIEEAKKLGISIEKGLPKAEIADEIYKKYCRSKIIQPCFLIHHPLGFQPLAKVLEKDSNKLANFQLVISGWEVVNAFSELNSPIEQEKRFKEQERNFKIGLKEAQRMDKDFIEALEYGMPPAAGFGMGIDRLVALLTDSHSLREVILFPTMRPKKRKTQNAKRKTTVQN